MAITLFGYKIGKEEKEEQIVSFVPPSDDDGATPIVGGGAYGTYLDLDTKTTNESQLITKYREMSLQAECDAAIDDIVNESIVYGESDYPVEIVLDNLEQPESVKKKIREEFEYILKLLDFNNQGYDIFRRWYIDGRIYYHMAIDEKNPRQGLKDIRYIDPRKIKKVKEITDKRKQAGVDVKLFDKPKEYYIYSDKGFAKDANTGLKISADSICFAHSGIVSSDGRTIVSHLHKAIKPLNQLRMLEDATVIYRISRAPERRIFYIDVGNLPKMKAEQYLRDIMNRYKNKLVYDANTGEVRDDRRFQTMLEDFWLPRREGGRGTQIDTLPAGQSLGEVDDVLYFQKKMYKSLNVPVSRLESEAGFSLGRASEITRDELKFNKFINRLRLRFSIMFDRLLETQLLLKGVCTKKEWKTLKENIYYDFLSDSHFTEMKEAEIMRERLGLLSEMDPYLGKYYSKKYIQKNILQLNDEDIKELEDEISKEAEEMDSDEDEQEFEPKQQKQEPVPVTIQKEQIQLTENSQEQEELAKSMTRFFDSLVDDEVKSFGEER